MYTQALGYRPKKVQFIKMERTFQDLRQLAQLLFLQIKLMTEFHFARSPNPSQLNIDQQAIDIIKNSLIKFHINSEYYVKVHEQDNLNFLMFLCLYQDKMATKKINEAFKNINPGQYEEIKTEYFNIKQDGFNIADIFEEKSGKFAYHEQLFKDNAKLFANLPLNSLFQHAAYSKTLRICQYKEKSLTQFKATPFKAKSIEDNKIQDVIVVFPTAKGYNIGCFSAKNRKVVNPSVIIEEEELKPTKIKKQEQKKQQQKKQEKQIEKSGNESEGTEVQEKMKANPSKEVQTEQVLLDEETQLYEQKDYNTFFALLAILAIIQLVHKFM